MIHHKMVHIALLIICLIYSLEGGITNDQTKPLVLLLLGSPGSGKATLVVKLSNTFALPYISYSKLLLNYVNEDSELGEIARDYLNAQDSVPDEVIFKLLFDRIQQADCNNGFLLDEFPKTLAQAKILQEQLEKSHLFIATSINVSEEWLLHRIEGRMVCQNCGKVYHLAANEQQTQCHICNLDLSQRDADSHEIIKKNLEKYLVTTEPILNFYKQKNLLLEIDGDRPLDTMLIEIKEVIPRLISASCSQKTQL